MGNGRIDNCSWRDGKLDQKANCLIRWVEHPERNVNIELSPWDNMYTVQVKAVYYAVISAVFHDTSHAIIYSPNDIVVKVGNGIFKPKKEIDMFNAIRRRTAKPNAGDSSFKTLVKLRLLDHETLEKASRRLRSSEGPETSAGAPLCYSERIFMKKHSNEINQL